MLRAALMQGLALGRVGALATAWACAIGTASGQEPVGPSPAAAASTDGEDASAREPWPVETARLRAQQAAAESSRLQAVADRLRLTDDRVALEQAIGDVRGSILLDAESRRVLLLPLLEREVELLSRDAIAALSRADEPQGRALIIAAAGALSALGDGAPAHIVAALARAREAYVEVLAHLAERAAEKGELPRARDRLAHARALAPSPDAPGGSGVRAAERFAAAERAVIEAAVKAIVDRGRDAELRADYRQALELYGEAVRRGAQVAGQLERVESRRRTPLAEAGMSLLVPGLGQATHGRAWVGGLFFAGTTAAVVGGILLNASAERRYDEYQAATTAEEAADRYDGINAEWTGALVLFGVGAILHVWNVYDAYSDAHGYNLAHF